ncbi:MAG: SpoIIE family protein phosphatase [Holophagales bacterium]|nr:SpoIIE family protein phosphatase [Holophagales bacterium]MYC09920.1 SpoIIE family protein phosphatase [Holophagales bacterium]
MKLRSQLILAFLVLAVLPLAGIVGYTYVSSARAFRAAVEAESLEVTRQISVGLLRTRDDVRGYMRRLGTILPFDDPQYADPEALVEFLWSTMGDGADFVDALELVPAVPPGRASGAERRRSPGSGGSGQRGRRPRDWVARVFGGPVSTPVHRDGDVVAHLEAAIRPENLMRDVLRRIPRSGGAVPFALDAEGDIYTSEPEELELLEEVHCAGDEPLLDALAAGHEDLCQGMSEWVVATQAAAEGELIYGIVRPIGPSLAEMRNASLRNLGVGVGILSLSMLAVAPLSNRLTRRLSHLTRQVDRLARGDAAARARLGGRDEVGKLGEAFNRMARDQEKSRQQLLEQERERRRQEVDRRLLEAENERQTSELEEARTFQLSLLPAGIPEHPDLEIAVFLRTASEVGGDYYDFSRLRPDGLLTIAVGDATGHGARAGTMVTVVKSLLSSADMGHFRSVSGTASPAPGAPGAPGAPALLDLADFLSHATATIRSMNLGRRAMALVLARYRDGALDLASAGMPPVLVSRFPAGEVEEIMTSGVPLGTLANASYENRRVRLEPGDAVLLMSDGLPEMLGEDGEPIGYAAVAERWREVGQRPAAEAVMEFERWVEELSPQGVPADDVTFVVIRRRPLE